MRRHLSPRNSEAAINGAQVPSPLRRWNYGTDRQIGTGLAGSINKSYSDAAMASQIFSMAGISAWLPGRRPLTRMEKATVLPLAVVM